MSNISTDLERALEKFAQMGPSVERDALAPLLTTAGAAPAAKDERFARGVDISIGRIKSDAPRRVQDLSILWRLTSVSAMREHRRRAISALNSGVPAFAELPEEMPDPDDRRHFADALSVVKGAWLPSYVARSIVSERDGEKARLSLSRAFVANTPNISLQIDLLREAFVGVRFEQQDPSAGKARRLASTLDALAEAIWTAEAEVERGEAFGKTFSTLISELLARRPTADRIVSITAARAVLQFAVTVIRLHGTLAAEASTYAFLEPLRRSLETTTWPSELSTELGRLANQILDQLVFLVQLKMPDTNLRRLFISLVGESTGKMRLNRVADETRGLDPEAAYWLRTGSHRRSLPTQAAIEETAVSAVDRDLGLALREAVFIRSAISTVETDVIAAATFHSPRLGADLKEAFERIDRLIAFVEAAARRRSLKLRGAVGDVVSFSPLEHEPVANAIGARTVRVISQAVERVVDGQTVGVIVKSDVDRI